MGQVEINGQIIEVPDGANISSINGDLFVNGARYYVGGPTTTINLTIKGDVGSVSADGSVKVQGNVKGSVKSGGSVTCGTVSQDVSAGGSVRVNGDSKGKITAGGSVKVSR